MSTDPIVRVSDLRAVLEAMRAAMHPVMHALHEAGEMACFRIGNAVDRGLVALDRLASRRESKVDQMEEDLPHLMDHAESCAIYSRAPDERACTCGVTQPITVADPRVALTILSDTGEGAWSATVPADVYRIAPRKDTPCQEQQTKSETSDACAPKVTRTLTQNDAAGPIGSPEGATSSNASPPPLLNAIRKLREARRIYNSLPVEEDEEAQIRLNLAVDDILGLNPEQEIERLYEQRVLLTQAHTLIGGVWMNGSHAMVDWAGMVKWCDRYDARRASGAGKA